MNKINIHLFFILACIILTTIKGFVNLDKIKSFDDDMIYNNTLTFYKIINKNYDDVNFTISNLFNDTYIDYDFGKLFTLDPIDYCKSDFEKQNAILCMRNNPELVWNWKCISEYCISI